MSGADPKELWQLYPVSVAALQRERYERLWRMLSTYPLELAVA